MNPITVRIFDTNRVKTCFLDMCVTTSSTAEAIFVRREILCATPTFDVISAHDMLYEEKVNK